MSLLDKTHRLMTTPGMARRWLRWNLGSLGLPPSVDLPAGGRISGFKDFSEYWSASAIIPTTSEIALIDRIAGHSGVVLDVGANLGCFALTLARLRPDCEIHAFEPSPATCRRLEANLQRNAATRVKAQPFALGKESGHSRFVDNRQSAALSRLVLNEDHAATDTIQVEVSTVDHFLDSIGDPPVAFMKIDVEGFEADVLRGAERTLTTRRCQAGLVEICTENFAQTGSSVDDLSAVLHSYGWVLHFLQADGGIGNPVTQAEAERIGLTNAVMLPGASL